MHRNAEGKTREEAVAQVKINESSVRDFHSYIPIGNAVSKLRTWSDQGAEIVYLSSHTSETGVEADKYVLERFSFPRGEVLYRKAGEAYRDIAERLVPDILVEDDCESIGGIDEMAYTHIKPELKEKIRLITVKEFGGIDHLPTALAKLTAWKTTQ